MSRRRSRISPFGAGLIVVVVVLIVTYLVFTNDIPFTRPFQIKAVVANAVLNLDEAVTKE